MTELPAPPPETPHAWVDEVDGTIIAAGQCLVSNIDLQRLPAGATRHGITLEQYPAIQAQVRSFCVVEGMVVPREATSMALSATSIAADGEAEVTLSGIPDGALLRTRGAATLPWTAITGGVASFTASVPGLVMIEVRCPAPHADWIGEFHAV